MGCLSLLHAGFTRNILGLLYPSLFYPHHNELASYDA